MLKWPICILVLILTLFLQHGAQALNEPPEDGEGGEPPDISDAAYIFFSVLMVCIFLFAAYFSPTGSIQLKNDVKKLKDAKFNASLNLHKMQAEKNGEIKHLRKQLSSHKEELKNLRKPKDDLRKDVMDEHREYIDRVKRCIVRDFKKKIEDQQKDHNAEMKMMKRRLAAGKGEMTKARKERDHAKDLLDEQNELIKDLEEIESGLREEMQDEFEGLKFKMYKSFDGYRDKEIEKLEKRQKCIEDEEGRCEYVKEENVKLKEKVKECEEEVDEWREEAERYESYWKSSIDMIKSFGGGEITIEVINPEERLYGVRRKPVESMRIFNPSYDIINIPADTDLTLPCENPEYVKDSGHGDFLEKYSNDFQLPACVAERIRKIEAGKNDDGKSDRLIMTKLMDLLQRRGETYASIADLTGIKEETVKTRVKRFRDKAKKPN